MKSLAVFIAIAFLFSGIIAGMDVQEINDFGSSNGNNVYEESYDLLIICPQQFYDPLIPFQWHKEQYGIKTIIVTLDEIYGSKYFPCQGRDDAEKVKYFIKDAYDNWHIKYFLLVGGRKPGLKEKWWMPEDMFIWMTKVIGKLAT